MPHYDETGNLVTLTGLADEVVGQYEYSPFGRVKPLNDDVLPQVSQVVVEGDQVWVESSEESLIDISGFNFSEQPNNSQADGEAPLKSVVIPVTITQPLQEGRQARRRLEITPSTVPSPGILVNLLIQPEGVQDLFLNELAAQHTVSFTWPDVSAQPLVVEDNAPPKVESFSLRDGHLEIAFSEVPDLALASGAVQVDGQTIAWVLEEDGYTLRSADVMAEGGHSVEIPSGTPVDRASKGLETTVNESITVTAGKPDEGYYELPDPRKVPVTTFVNRFAFHGRPLDGETGLAYFRNRFYDPDLGRFATADPLGYVDGPSAYQFAPSDPLDYNDPLVCRLVNSWNK